MTRRELLAVLPLLPRLALASADAGTAVVPFPHGSPLVSFGTSPDGRFLATGACCSPTHADDPSEGVTCWDLRTLRPKWTTRLDGGVGLDDQLRGGVVFSPDGRFVGANSHTNEVSLLDAAEGQLLATIALTSDDGPPAWCWSSDPTHRDSILVHAEGRLQLAPVKGPPQAMPGPAGWPLALDASGSTVVTRDTLSRGARQLPLPTKNGARALCAAVSPTALVVGAEAGALLVVDRASFSVRQRLSMVARAVAVSRRNDVVVVIGRSLTDASVVRGARVEAVPGPLARHDWLEFADGLPVALSADGARVATIDSTGAVFEVTSGQRRALGVVSGATALTWPTDDRLVALGRDVVGFLEPGQGVLAVSRR